MKIVFFGTSDVGLPILNALVENHEVVLVVSSPDAPIGRKQILTPSPISEFSVDRGLKLEKPERVKNNPGFLDLLRQQHADIFIVVSYGKILPEELLNIPPLKTVNVHFSLLPKWRGAAPIQYALLNGETKTGTTIFVLDAEVDHGPILAQEQFPIESDDTFTTLAQKLAEISAELLIKILPLYQSGDLKAQPQNHTEATFTKLIKKEDGFIDWAKPAQEIYNQFRAFKQWPGIYTTWQNKTLKILDCRPADPTQINNLTIIPCGNSTALELVTVQLEGKKPTNMVDFVRGYPNFSSSDLG